METIEVVLAMLLAVIASGYIGRMLPIAVPLPLIQITFGVIFQAVFQRGIQLDPDIFFLLFLPPLLFVDGWRVPNVGLLRDKSTILELAFGLVIFTVLGAGYLLHWLIPSMPLAVAFALAAIVAPTDPVAVSSITERVPMPTRLMHIIEGESLLNDASGLVCFRFAVAAAMTGQFSLAKASFTFLWVALAGVAVGMVVTWAITRFHGMLQRRFGEPEGVPVLINIVTPFAAYLAAEQIEASGILAAVAAGITMSYVELTGAATPTTRIRREVVWDTLQTTLNGLMFVLLGEQLPVIVEGALHPYGGGAPFDLWWLAKNALLFSVALVVLRFVWVFISLKLTILSKRRMGEQVYLPRMRLILAASVSGVRGALTMAGVFTLPLLLPNGEAFPARNLAIFLASSVIIVSLVLASVALPALLRDLEVPEEPATECNADQARRAAMRAAVFALEKAKRDLGRRPGPDPQAHEVRGQVIDHMLSIYRHRLPRKQGGDGKFAANGARRVESEIGKIALGAERETVLRLARHMQISDETARELMRNIDLLEARYEEQ